MEIEDDVYGLWGILPFILMLLALTGIASLISMNQLAIENNWKCIEIKHLEGENKDFSECVNKSKKINIGWISPHLEKDYEDILDKFCR